MRLLYKDYNIKKDGIIIDSQKINIELIFKSILKYKKIGIIKQISNEVYYLIEGHCVVIKKNEIKEPKKVRMYGFNQNSINKVISKLEKLTGFNLIQVK